MPKVIPIEKVEDIRNKVKTIDENSTDDQYPSAKAVYDEIEKIRELINSLSISE